MLEKVTAVVLGLFAAGVLVVVATVGLYAGFRLLRRWRRRRLPKKLFIELDLSAPLGESEGSDPLGKLFNPAALSLKDVVETLGRAEQDARVLGVLLNCSDISIGLAQAQEIRGALSRLAAAGKEIVAYADTFGEGGSGWVGYFVACAAGSIAIQPSGDVNLTGFSAEQPFVREGLERLGVTPRFQQRHEYKSVIELFERRDMSEAAKESLRWILDGIVAELTTAVSAGRPDTDVDRVFADGPFVAREALERRLIDRVAYRDEVLDELRERHGEKLAFRFLSHYRSRTRSTFRKGPVLAVVTGEGDIVRGESSFNPRSRSSSMGARTVAAALRAAMKDEDVKGVLFRVNTRGGSYIASDTIWREVARAEEAGKPVVVWMGDYAASGGYFVSAPARAIVAQPLTLTGSIGVAGGKFVLRELWSKLGIRFDGVRTHDSSIYFSPNHDYDEHGAERARSGMDRAYADFTGKVATGRKLDEDTVDGLARGRVWTGRQAQERGLVDELGGFSVALERLKKECTVEGPVRLREFPRARALWEQALRSESKSSEDEGVAATYRPPLEPLFVVLGWLRLAGALLRPRPGIQMKVFDSFDDI